MLIDRFVKFLLPRDGIFYQLLEEGSGKVSAIADLFVQCCEASTFEAREKLVVGMREVEHAADRVIREVSDRLNRTFVTPIDREDIFELAGELENVVDVTCSTAQQIIVHSMEELPPGSLELARLLKDASVEICAAVRDIRYPKKFGEIRARCTKLGQLESQADAIFRDQIGNMFRTERDAIRLLKFKEFLEGAEHALDVCDDVADALDAIVMKNA